MNTQIRILAASLLVLSSSTVVFAGTPQDKADAAQINTACVDDAKTAGCGGEVVGKGLLKCLHAYKKTQRQTNKSFAFSSSCEAAIHQLRSDKKAGK